MDNKHFKGRDCSHYLVRHYLADLGLEERQRIRCIKLILQSVTHHLIRKWETFPFPAASANFNIWAQSSYVRVTENRFINTHDVILVIIKVIQTNHSKNSK